MGKGTSSEGNEKRDRRHTVQGSDSGETPQTILGQCSNQWYNHHKQKIFDNVVRE